jgi:hypothetical protein
MNKTRALLFVLALALLAVACGDAGEKVSGTATTVAAAPQHLVADTPTTALAATNPALAAKATAATLQKADFPAGFEPQKEEPGQGLQIDALWADLTRCLGVGTGAPPAGTATSPTFLRGLATQGRSTVEYTSEPAAAAIATALTGPKAQTCLDQAFAADLNRSKPEGSTPGPVTVASRTVASAAGQKTLAWRVNASVNLGDLVVPLFQDFQVTVSGGTVVRMLFLNPGAEFPQDLEKTLVDKVQTRATPAP